MSAIKWIAAMIIACAIAFGAGWASKKPQEVVRVEEKVVERVVEKIIEVEKKKQQKVTKITQKPDGTTTTTIIDTTTETNISERDSRTERESNTTSNTERIAGEAYRPTYSIGAEAVTDFQSLEVTYRMNLGYRILGNAWVSGGYDHKRNELGAGIRVDF